MVTFTTSSCLGHERDDLIRHDLFLLTSLSAAKSPSPKRHDIVDDWH